MVFRAEMTVPHDPPTMPLQVSPSIPVYSIIPRRVIESRLHVYYEPGVEVKMMVLSNDHHKVTVGLVNHNNKYNIMVSLDDMQIAGLCEVFVPAGRDYVVPPIKLTCIA
uniref:Glutamyl-tRNA(Gln) amidotransferase subunit A n=1 Tax=Lygus hesperus TaxID=30085 RepID=A0A0A9VUF1_LYGHE